MSSTRHIREEDLVGSPPIEVAREGNLLGSRSIQTEAKERHDWTRLRANGVTTRTRLSARAVATFQRTTRGAHRSAQTLSHGRDLRSGRRASTSSVKEEDGAWRSTPARRATVR